MQNGLKVRSLDVYVDDAFVVDLAYGREHACEVEPGDRIVKVSNRLFSKQLMVSVRPDETLRLQVGNRMGGFGMLLSGIGLPLYQVFIERE